MRGLKQEHSARVVIAGHAFVQNLRRGHYELAVEEPAAFELPPRSTSWLWRSDPSASNGFGIPPVDQMQQSRRPSAAATSTKVHPSKSPYSGSPQTKVWGLPIRRTLSCLP
jgi:hypothetical protein